MEMCVFPQEGEETTNKILAQPSPKPHHNDHNDQPNANQAKPSQTSELKRTHSLNHITTTTTTNPTPRTRPRPNPTQPNATITTTNSNQRTQNQTKPNQTKPNQTKPNQTKPNQTKPKKTNRHGAQLARVSNSAEHSTMRPRRTTADHWLACMPCTTRRTVLRQTTTYRAQSGKQRRARTYTRMPLSVDVTR